MIKIRQNVFETNSSSTHSLVMCDDNEYQKWQDGEIFYCSWFPYDADETLKHETSHFYTKDEAKAICESADIGWDEDDDCSSERKEYFVTLAEFCDSDYLESGEQKYVTPNGEVVHAVFKYGYDG